ncbi:MAG: T9SS type A sorting domain-containing protein [Flavobacterium sp.]|uniref:T9SS type A sorting domain-containing protein n=1 Tax=Flavobacterium sp. TaxID=239 RepID=UPI0022CC8869|nr:T9SS type A sorting domain-containing protein [Flavobacterium sp.]MCZ8168965.1 T9SS type A sorting domain-containing protein [Flavobacterium sp.]MCZ8296309.1 T9SS type A sorting domain-containing protein [Flavobacterium sp.]
MKKVLLAVLMFPVALQAQVLLTEDFNGLTVGNVSDNITGATPGQGDYFFFASNGAAPTTSTNAAVTNAQIVSLGAGDLALSLLGPNGNNGSRFVWQDTFPGIWTTRTSGNNIIELEVDINPGAGTTLSRNTFGVYIFNADADRVLAGFVVRAATRELLLVAYSTPTGNPVGNYTYSLAAAPGIQLPANTVSRIGISYNVTTRQAIIKGPGIAAAGIIVTGSSTATDPAEIDFVSFAGSSNTVVNAEASTMVMDNLVVRASNTDTLLNTTEIASAGTLTVYPNPSTDVFNVNSPVAFSSYTITDINGRVVKTATLEAATQAQINVVDLAPGAYILNIASENGSASHKIIKQ